MLPAAGFKSPRHRSCRPYGFTLASARSQVAVNPARTRYTAHSLAKLCLARNGPPARPRRTGTSHRKTRLLHHRFAPYFFLFFSASLRNFATLARHTRTQIAHPPERPGPTLARKSGIRLCLLLCLQHPSPIGTLSDDRVERGGHATVPRTGCRAPSAPLP